MASRASNAMTRPAGSAARPASVSNGVNHARQPGLAGRFHSRPDDDDDDSDGEDSSGDGDSENDDSERCVKTSVLHCSHLSARFHHFTGVFSMMYC